MTGGKIYAKEHCAFKRTALILGLLTLVGTSGCDRWDSNRLSAIESRVTALETLVSELKRQEPSAQPKEEPRVSAGSEAVSAVDFTLSGNEKDDSFLGSPSAPLILMAFFDFNSASSKKFVETSLTELKNSEIKNGALKFILRDFPLSTTEEALSAAVTTHCAGEQGFYWKLFEALLSMEVDISKALSNLPELDRIKLAKCQDSTRYYLEIERDIADARLLGARGAPSFFLGRCVEGACRGSFIRGAQPIGVFRKVIQEFDTARQG